MPGYCAGEEVPVSQVAVRLPISLWEDKKKQRRFQKWSKPVFIGDGITYLLLNENLRLMKLNTRIYFPSQPSSSIVGVKKIVNSVASGILSRDALVNFPNICIALFSVWFCGVFMRTSRIC